MAGAEAWRCSPELTCRPILADMSEFPSLSPLCFEFRTVTSSDELAHACRFVSSLILEAPYNTKQVAYIQERFPQDGHLMFTASTSKCIIGAGLGVQKYGAVLVALLGVVPQYRNLGIARRFLELIEIEAMRLGAGMVSLGAVESARSFYRHVGYSGKSSYHKQLPSQGRVLDARLNRLAQAVGDLDHGSIACIDTRTGKLPRIL